MPRSKGWQCLKERPKKYSVLGRGGGRKRQKADQPGKPNRHDSVHQQQTMPNLEGKGNDPRTREKKKHTFAKGREKRGPRKTAATQKLLAKKANAK